MSLNLKSIAVAGFGFGALAIATSGYITTSVAVTVPPPSISTGGSGGRILNIPLPNKKRVEVNRQKHIELQRANDEILLQVIINAVTQELLE